MKKQLSLASKRKWVTGGILAFSAVSLLTTGFATWVVGVQRTKQHEGLDVVVDTASNQTVMITATLAADQQFEIAEPSEITTGLVTTNSSDVGWKADGLKITFSSIEVFIGTGATTSYTNVEFALGTLDSSNELVPEVHGTNEQLINDIAYGTGTDKISSGRAALAGEEKWTYVVSKSTNNFALSTDANPTVDENGKTYHFTNVVFELDWGTFFGGKTPCTYYNQVCAGYTQANASQLANITNAVTGELNSMEDYFEGLSAINLVISLA